MTVTLQFPPKNQIQIFLRLQPEMKGCSADLISNIAKYFAHREVAKDKLSSTVSIALNIARAEDIDVISVDVMHALRSCARNYALSKTHSCTR